MMVHRGDSTDVLDEANPQASSRTPAESPSNASGISFSEGSAQEGASNMLSETNAQRLLRTSDTPSFDRASDESANKTPWSGRFEDVPSDFIQKFGASLPVDKRLWHEDIKGSLAHATMLKEQGLLTGEEFAAIGQGMASIVDDIVAGTFVWDIADEDVHMAIEAELTRRIGDAGKKLHTGRSRNDQVATDFRLWAKSAAKDLLAKLDGLIKALQAQGDAHDTAIMPGYTHLQKAQPVRLAHHLDAYVQMFTRDKVRVQAAYDAADVNVLGSGALAGTPYPLDRRMTADILGFTHVSSNTLDGVSDRDFALDLVYACSVCQMHLSRLAEEIILWSTEEFGFITLADACSTGSSIMPQKKNPDFAELVRGKSGRVYGDLLALLTTMKGLPLAYNKDMQEDKEPAFDAVDATIGSLIAMTEMIDSAAFNIDAMHEAAHGGFMAATDLADYLVGKGMPFRDAHEVVGRIVLKCEKEGRKLQDLSTEEYHAQCDLFDDQVIDAIDIENVVKKRIDNR